MSEQQSAPEQLAAGKSQGGAGATYKVLEQPGLMREGLHAWSGLVQPQQVLTIGPKNLTVSIM